MDEEATFQAALRADPSDRTTRLVFADWLQERDDLRAAWLRDDRLWHWNAVGMMEWVKPHPLSAVERIVNAATQPVYGPEAVFHRQLLRAIGSAAVPLLRAWWLEAPADRIRHMAGLLDFLQAHPPPDLSSVTKLVSRLANGAWYVQWLAIIDLGHHGPAAKRAVRRLLELPLHEEWEEMYPEPEREHPRSMALHYTLGEIGPAAGSATSYLARVGWYNHGAYPALRKIRPDPLSVLENINDDDDWTTKEGLELVAELDPTGTSALLHAVRHCEGRKRREAAKLLGEMGPAVAPLLPALLEVLRTLDGWELEFSGDALRKAVDRIRGLPAPPD